MAEKLKLSEEQKNAGYKGGDNIFWYVVDEAFQILKREGKLKQPGGPRTPYFLENPPIEEEAIGIHINVENFGPIEKAEIDLRPADCIRR